MARISNDHGFQTRITFNEGVIPTAEMLRGMYPKRGLMHRDLDVGDLPKEESEAQAWLLTAHAQHHARRTGYDASRHGPLETWLLLPSNGHGKFDGWFLKQPSGYRLLVHRAGMEPVGGPEYFRYAHRCFDEAHRHIGLRRRHLPGPELTAPVRDFVNQVASAYEADPKRLERLFRSSGHRFVRSCGPLSF